MKPHVVTVRGREVYVGGVLDFRGYDHGRAVGYARWLVGRLNRMRRHRGSSLGAVTVR